MDELVYKAICEDRPMRLEVFLKQGGDPNMWIEDSARISAKSFLHVCCEKGRIRCVKVTIDFLLNPLPDDKILDWSKLKQIADDILKCI